MHRSPKPSLLIIILVVLAFVRLGATTFEADNATLDVEISISGNPATRLSQEAIEYIGGLDDHPVEDNDEARADRMLSALEGIPENERTHLGLDVAELRRSPLAERLMKLEALWSIRQRELKEAYEAMPKVHEQLSGRLEILEDGSASKPELVATLVDLEDLLSDIDMARDFHSLGGFSTLASMLAVSQPESVREAAAWAIGTAVKNEPEHQRWILEDEGGSRPSALVLLLENAGAAGTSDLRSKVVYALSACLNNNEGVQLQFGSLGGAAKLSVMYEADGSDSRLRTKILALFSDLLREAARGSLAAVLATTPVGTTPSSGGVWCARVDQALREAPSAVALEKALEAVVAFAPSCRDQFRDLVTRESVLRLAGEYPSSASSGGAYWGDEEFQAELILKLGETAKVLV